MRQFLAAGLGAVMLAACAANPPAGEQLAETQPDTEPAGITSSETRYTIMVSGTEIGAMDVLRYGPAITVDYEYRNNGRGPTLEEAIVLDEDNLPIAWSISGNTTFGNDVDEAFAVTGDTATWVDSTGEGSADITGPAMYITQSGTPYDLGIYARAPYFPLQCTEIIAFGRYPLLEQPCNQHHSPTVKLFIWTFAVLVEPYAYLATGEPCLVHSGGSAIGVHDNQCFMRLLVDVLMDELESIRHVLLDATA